MEKHGFYGNVIIISDSCYSGNWVEAVSKLKQKYYLKYIIMASSDKKNISYDTPDGGLYT